jgi:hypothetical protein
MRLGLVTELEHTRAPYSDHSYALEIVPILDFSRNRWTASLNPGMEWEFAAEGQESEVEWEPGARFGFQVTPRLNLNLEYFSAVGEIGELRPMVQQVHQFYPGVDLRIGEDLLWSFGLGVGVTSAGNRLTFKTRFEIPLMEK